MAEPLPRRLQRSPDLAVGEGWRHRPHTLQRFSLQRSPDLAVGEGWPPGSPAFE